jgi:acylphosphatase
MEQVIRLLVKGRVQGVGFRAFAESTARRLGVAGWARNLPTGDVEILARVTPENRQSFLDAIRRGPQLSRVDDVQTGPPLPGHECPVRGFSAVG